MATKDWERFGTSWYILKGAKKGAVWVDKRTDMTVSKDGKKVTAKTGYKVYHSYVGDNGTPELLKTTTSKEEAHKVVMNHVKTKSG